MAEDIELQVSNTLFSLVGMKARETDWTRDPFDRLITAEVMIVENAQLVTKDAIIRENCERAVW